MSRDISIVITAKDNFTQTITTMRSTTQSFNKDMDILRGKINSVNKTKVTIKTDTAKAIKDLKKLETQFAKTGTASDKLKQGMGDINTAASKMENKAASSMGSFLKGFAANGGSKLVIDTVSKGATTYMTSALGSEEGTLVENGLNMGIAGAQIGAMAGPVGAAVGAAIGAGLGLINGAIENYAAEDEAFKTYVKNQYQGIVQERSNMSTNASNLAASQENADDPSSFMGVTKTLNDTMNQMAAAEGTAYNDERANGEGGLEDQIEFYNGENGQELQKANTAIGEWEAHLANLKDQYQMDAQNALFGGEISDSFSGSSRNELKRMAEEYKKAEAAYDEGEGDVSAGATMQRLLDEAKALATNEYSGSDDAKKEQESNEVLITNLQASAEKSDAGWQSVRSIEEKLTKGQASVNPGVPIAQFYSSYGGYTPTGTTVIKSSAKPSAYGLSYVPYNNFPALLHEGERVLTASENRNFRGRASITITGNSFTVREEADINKIARALSREIEKARMVMAV